MNRAHGPGERETQCSRPSASDAERCRRSRSIERSARAAVGRRAAEGAGRSADSAGAVSGSQGARRAALAEVWSYINPFMLYGRHLGYKGNFEKDLADARTEGARAVPRAWKR